MELIFIIYKTVNHDTSELQKFAKKILCYVEKILIVVKMLIYFNKKYKVTLWPIKKTKNMKRGQSNKQKKMFCRVCIQN